jgi:hypothetical protein
MKSMKSSTTSRPQSTNPAPSQSLNASISLAIYAITD